MSDDENISIYDEIEIEDMTFDEAMGVYHYPCPCGDKFQIALDDLLDEQDIAVCPSCSLMIRVIFDLVRWTTFYVILRALTMSRMTYRNLPPRARRAARSPSPPKCLRSEDTIYNRIHALASPKTGIWNSRRAEIRAPVLAAIHRDKVGDGQASATATHVLTGEATLR
ncbi:hypothetical protein NM208_g17234 [Fusarium decemcellulare]|uniref:Uncharacterized protein n=1 Tax=Fusarium decemcellulare TaxID=57161 RepID=A0ACC1RBC5_9HYPO|nr:hypothetical protein NM208_g17234 [Fusarium decemcellulare]